MELVQGWHDWLGEQVKSLMRIARQLIELAFSMSLCCFPAVLIVQGIIAKRQNGMNIHSQHWSDAMPKLIHTATVTVWDRGNWIALLRSAGSED